MRSYRCWLSNWKYFRPWLFLLPELELRQAWQLRPNFSKKWWRKFRNLCQPNQKNFYVLNPSGMALRCKIHIFYGPKQPPRHFICHFLSTKTLFWPEIGTLLAIFLQFFWCKLMRSADAHGGRPAMFHWLWSIEIPQKMQMQVPLLQFKGFPLHNCLGQTTKPGLLRCSKGPILRGPGVKKSSNFFPKSFQMVQNAVKIVV